jgi:hypothetical protein
MKLSQPVLGIAPKRLNATDMPATTYKLIVAIVDPKVIVKKTISTTPSWPPAIGTNDSVGIDFARDDRL